MCPLELRPGQVDVWQIDLKAFQDPSRLPAYLDLLGPDERVRYSQFAFEHLRQNYLVAHALTRLILARYEETAPAALSFTRNAFGRPELGNSQCGLRFSLSHTPAFAALAVTKAWDIGVDLECDDRPVSPLVIAERFFARSEAAWLRVRPPASLKSAFLDLWSLKEAYVKACGLGLSLALDGFAIDLSQAGHPRLAHVAPPGDDPAQWKLFLLRPRAGCALGLAVRCGASAQPDVATFEAAPAGDNLAATPASPSRRPTNQT